MTSNDRGVWRSGQRRRAQLWALGAVSAFGGFAAIANWPAWPGDPALMRQGDPTLVVWFLSWTARALSRGINPFFTNYLNYPRGINLVQNTAMPLLGILTAPLTLAVSPIASLNLLLWLAIMLSASSMFFVLRRWVQRPVAAFIGGLLYGFSPYMTGQGSIHLHLVFVPLPPLIFLALIELLVRRHDRPVRWGLVLGVLMTAQFFISSEVLATTAIVAIAGLMILGASHPRQVVPALHDALPGIFVAGFIVAACIAYPVWVMVAGPDHYRGPAFPGGLSADLLGPVIPTSSEQFAPGAVSIGNRLASGNVPENGSYLGVPLLMLLVVIGVSLRRDRWVRLLCAMAVGAFALSLGPVLIVDGRVTGFRLPFDLIQHVPLLNNVLTVRFSLYVALFAAVLVAMGIDRIDWQTRRVSDDLIQSSKGRWGATNRKVLFGLTRSAIGLLAAAAMISLIPSWPYSGTTPANVPTYFTTSAASNQIPPGSVVLMSPYPSVAEVLPLLYQAAARMRFKIIGGYGIFRTSAGTASPFTARLKPYDVEAYLWAKETGGPPYPVVPIPTTQTSLVQDTKTFLRNYHVGTVLVTTAGADPQAAYALFDQALGPPSVVVGGVSAWYQVQSHTHHFTPRTRSSRHSSSTP